MLLCIVYRYLYGFEDYCTSTGITFRMDLPFKVAEKQSSQAEGSVDGEEGASSIAVSAAVADEPKPEEESDVSTNQSVVKVYIYLNICRGGEASFRPLSTRKYFFKYSNKQAKTTIVGTRVRLLVISLWN